MNRNFRYGEVAEVLAKIAQNREKAEEAFLAIEFAKVTQAELYARFCNLSEAQQSDCLVRLKRIASSAE